MANQGRPKKVRFIQSMPQIMQFSPRGKPGRPDEVELTIDQFESIKLSDFQGFSQAEGAAAMRLSRASFGRILREARKTLADGLVNGKIIKIRMGDFQVGVRKSEFTHESLGAEIEKFKERTKRILKEAAKPVKKVSPDSVRLLSLKSAAGTSKSAGKETPKI